jgi:hypothetical protein
VTLKAPFDRITIEPGKMGGKPGIRGLRISVENVLNIIASFPDRRDCSRTTPISKKRTCGKPSPSRLPAWTTA